MILSVYVDEADQRRLEAIALETGRSVEDLASAAVSEAALEAYRHRKDDPFKQRRRAESADLWRTGT